MPIDLAHPFSIDDTGDATTVNGEQFYEQHAQILGGEALTDIAGGPLTANERTEIQSRVEQRLEQSPYFADTVRVRVATVKDETIVLDTQVGVPVDTVTVPLLDT